MIAVPGIYENGKIILLEQIPNIRRARVVVTVLEEWPDETPPNGADQEPGSWVGSMRHTLTGEIGDIVSPLEETWSDWEVLRE
jgi:hypothetical protein